MSETTTLIAFLIAAVLFVLAHWQARREREPGRLPLIPWTAVQFVALVGVVLLLAHLISIWSGHPLVGRRG